MKINAGEVCRADYFFIDPHEIIVDRKLNGRWEPHDEAAVTSLVKSFEEEGQLQAVQVRRVVDNRVQLVMGYRRHAAAVEFNKRHPDQPMKLKAVVVTLNDEEAFRRNIVENRERRETTPIDDAYNHRRLRDNFGWTDSRIAEFYGFTASYVGLLKKLLSLPTDTQKLVHGRQLSVKAAAALTELTPEEQQKALEPMPEPAPVQVDSAPVLPEPASAVGEKLASRVVKAVRAAKIEKGGKQARSLAEIRKFFEGLTGPGEKPRVKTLAEMMLNFIQGRLTDKTMEHKLNELSHAQVEVQAKEGPTPFQAVSGEGEIPPEKLGESELSPDAAA